MKQKLIIFLFAISFNIQAGITSLKGDSKIQAVTIFKDRALVRRQQTIALKAGAQTIIFNQLPTDLEAEYLKVELTNKKDVMLLGFRHEEKSLEVSQNPELEKWRARGRVLAIERNRLLEEVSSISKDKKNLQDLMEHYKESFTLNLHQEKWSKGGFISLVDLILRQSKNSNSQWYKLFMKYNEVEKEREQVQARIRENESGTEKGMLVVSIDVVAERPTTTDCSLQYLVRGASWNSTYDLRLDTLQAKANLELSALVHQETGEDWDGVELTLSNVRAELNPVPPTLSGYVLSMTEKQKVKTIVQSENQEKAEHLVAGNVESGTRENTFAQTFKIKGLQYVRSRRSEEKIFIQKMPTHYSERLDLVASQYPYVFQRIEIKNPFHWDLAAGSLNVYSQGAFISQTRTEEILKGANFSVNIGVERALDVNRVAKDETGTSGIINQKAKTIKGFTTSIENRSGKPFQIRVWEQVPESELSEVSISTEGSTEGLKKSDSIAGWHYWDLSIPAQKKENVLLKMTLLAPKEFQMRW